MFTSGWKVWFASVIMPFLGFGLGYGIARILKQSHKKCRTVAFETGCQNVALTLTLILLTFSDHPQFGDLVTFPSLYGILQIIDALFCVMIWKIVTKFRKSKTTADSESLRDQNGGECLREGIRKHGNLNHWASSNVM